MPSGTATLSELATLVADGAVDTVILGFPDLYGRLLGKRLDAGFFLDDPSGTHAYDYLFAADMEMQPVEGYDFASWAGGYGDLGLVPDLGTLRVLPWLDRTALVICDALTKQGEPVGVAPRSILREQVRRAADSRFTLRAASELEYFLFRTIYREAVADEYRSLTPAGWYNEDYSLLQGTWTEDLNGEFRRQLTASGVPVESSKGEAAVGQHEINIAHSPVLEMADRHTLVKQCCKEVAGGQRDVHGQATRRPGRFQQPPPSQPLAGRRERVRGGATPRRGSCLGRVPLVPGRRDGPRPRAVRLPGSHGQRLPALPGAELGAGQPDCRLPRRRGVAKSPNRMPPAGGRRESVPGLLGGAGLGTRRHREADRAAATPIGRRLRGEGSGPVAVNTG